MPYKKSHLPEKICPVCKRPFTWRKKWKKNWNEIKYCSERCRREKKKQLVFHLQTVAFSVRRIILLETVKFFSQSFAENILWTSGLEALVAVEKNQAY